MSMCAGETTTRMLVFLLLFLPPLFFWVFWVLPFSLTLDNYVLIPHWDWNIIVSIHSPLRSHYVNLVRVDSASHRCSHTSLEWNRMLRNLLEAPPPLPPHTGYIIIILYYLCRSDLHITVVVTTLRAASKPTDTQTIPRVKHEGKKSEMAR